MNDVFFLYALTYPREFAGLLSPAKVTTILLKPEDEQKSAWRRGYRSHDESNIRKIYIRKPSKGKYDNDGFSDKFDHIYYAIMSFVYLPLILRHKKVVFIFPPFYTSLLIPILKLFRKKVYIISKDSEQAKAMEFKQTFRRKVFYWFMKQLEIMSIKMADHTFAFSKSVMEYYKRYTPNVSNMPTGADVKHIEGVRPKRIDEKRFTISYIGELEKMRGLDMLIKATKDLNVHVVIRGAGADAERLKKLAGKNIMIMPHIDHEEGMAYCKGSDLLVLCNRNVPASTTTSSIKVFEYIACEVPCMVTDSGEHADWVRKTGAGIVVRDNVKSIRAGIIEMMSNAELRQKCISEAHKNKWMVDYKQFKKEFVEMVNGTNV